MGDIVWTEVKLNINGMEYDSYGFEANSRGIQDCIDSFKIIPDNYEPAEILTRYHVHGMALDCCKHCHMWVSRWVNDSPEAMSVPINPIYKHIAAWA